jgi:curved DNA-binding protein CbpA
MATSAPKDAYAVLGVDPGCDDETIAAAYRSLARRYHPDIAGEKATARMMRINAAWDRLRDPKRRADYDDELRDIDPVRAAAARRRPRPRPKPQAAPDAEAPRATPYEAWSRPAQRDGTGAAGPPPGRPSGTVLPFGRHIGWSIGEIARADAGYLVWLEGRNEGRPYWDEIDATLRKIGYRTEDDRRGSSATSNRFRRG